MNKRILFSLGTILFVGAVVATATGAFFSDTETSNGNTFTAGSINLAIGSSYSSAANGSGTQGLTFDNNGRTLFNFTDIKPGDKQQGSFEMQVTSNPAYACVAVDNTTNPENTATEPEVESGDSTANGSNDGELQNYLQLAFFNDANHNHVYDSGETMNNNNLGDNNGFTVAELDNGGYYAIADDNSNGVNYTLLGTTSLQPNQQYDLGFISCFGNIDENGQCSDSNNSAENRAQTDQVTGSINFYSVQTRNNPNFTCSSLASTTNSTQTVSSNNLSTNNWYFYNDSTNAVSTTEVPGQFELENGPGTPPAGSGSAGFTMTTGTEKYAIATMQFAGTKLSDITALSYATYRTTGDPAVAMSLQFDVDSDATDANTAFMGRLVYEPYFTHTVTPGTWQTWNTLDNATSGANGNWWFSNGTLAAGPNACSQSKPCTWNQIKAAYPNAAVRPSVGQFLFRTAGTGPADLNVDALTFNTTSNMKFVDFEN